MSCAKDKDADMITSGDSFIYYSDVYRVQSPCHKMLESSGTVDVKRDGTKKKKNECMYVRTTWQINAEISKTTTEEPQAAAAA